MRDLSKTQINLHRYIENTSEIRLLSSPNINEVKDADEYRELLINNFIKIGELSKENCEILEDYYFPLINNEDELDHDTIEIIRTFSRELIDAYKLSFLDIPIAYQQGLILLNKLNDSDNEADIILALDNMVSVAYAMISVTGRLYPVSDVCLEYQKVGLGAALQLTKYLEHDKFKKLDDESKRLVLINARYLRVVSEIDGVPYDKELNSINLQRMKDALDLVNDPFYREQLPNYDWAYHRFRVLEYIASYTDHNNARGFNDEELEYINNCTKELIELYNSNLEYYKSIDNAKVMELYRIRNAYLTHEISLSEYKSHLKKTFDIYCKEKITEDSLAVLYAPLEYMSVIDKNNLKKGDITFLNDFYNQVIDFMHKTPKKNSLMFLIYIISFVLKNYIEIPEGMDFETLCLGTIAAVHPPTYVHTRSVADLSLCIAQHLFKEKPELFKDLPIFDEGDDERQKASTLRQFVYRSALTHDVGKLMIAETILTYGRNLLDSEFDLVYSHPEAGAYLLKRNESTEDYVDIALGHHKWYNDQNGYPKDFSLKDSKFRIIIEIITCADCLDAATDEVGRSYKKGISLDEYLEELKEGSGSRYAPYLYDLLIQEDVKNEIEELITKGRRDNYKKVFDILKTHAADI